MNRRQRRAHVMLWGLLFLVMLAVLRAVVMLRGA